MFKQIPKGGLAFENSWTVPTMKTKQKKKTRPGDSSNSYYVVMLPTNSHEIAVGNPCCFS